MKKIALLLCLLFSLSAVALGQKIFKDERYGFSMQEPENWMTGDKKMITENLGKLKLDEDELAKLIKSSNGSYLLTSFYKYDPKTHAGVIPTIQINVRTNPTKTFEQFSAVMNNSMGSLQRIFNDFSFVKKLEATELNGAKALYFVGTYTLTIKGNESTKVRVSNYSIPYGNYFFQVSFINELAVDEDVKLFDALAKTIKIGR